MIRTICKFVSLFSILLFSIIPVSAKHLADTNTTDYIVEEDMIYTYFPDGVSVVAKVDGSVFDVIVPGYLIEKDEEIKSVIGTVWAVISVTLTSCQLIEWTSGVNPCEVTWKYLMSSIAIPTTGRYSVSSTYIPGKIPGCEPAYSGPCNSGYYKYSFIKQ